MLRSDGLPHFLTVKEAADLIRVSRAAFYQMLERGQIPGVVRRSKRRILIATATLLHWLHQQEASSTARSVR